MAQSQDLGTVREVELPQGTLRYRERGEGPPVLFIHGLLVNGDLWRKVVPRLAGPYRCITPDLPLGSHELPMRADADLSIAGLARLVADLIRVLELEDVTLVANDTGGAITQVVMTEHPERIGRVVLTSCDAFENFLPAMFRPLQLAAHVPPLLTAALQLFRLRAVRRLPLGFGWLARYPIDPEIEAGYAGPVLANRDVRRDCFKVLRDISPRYTLRAAEKLGDFDRPVLLAWAADDRFFPVEHAKRLAAALPQARVALVPDSYTFVSEDQPETLVKLMSDFLAA
jgi:pimeloyl-ACP methyl ester carboxylesterase